MIRYCALRERNTIFRGWFSTVDSEKYRWVVWGNKNQPSWLFELSCCQSNAHKFGREPSTWFGCPKSGIHVCSLTLEWFYLFRFTKRILLRLKAIKIKHQQHRFFFVKKNEICLQYNSRVVDSNPTHWASIFWFLEKFCNCNSLNEQFGTVQSNVQQFS